MVCDALLDDLAHTTLLGEFRVEKGAAFRLVREHTGVRSSRGNQGPK